MYQSPFHSTEQSDMAFFIKGFDVNKPIHTNSSEVVDIITTNGPGPAPVIGLIFPGRMYNHQIRNGAGKLHRWNYDGKSYDANISVPRALDLAKNVQRNFDWSLPYQTRSRCEVTIISHGRRGARSIVALVANPRGSEQVVLYHSDGRTRNDGQETDLDLVNI